MNHLPHEGDTLTLRRAIDGAVVHIIVDYVANGQVYYRRCDHLGGLLASERKTFAEWRTSITYHEGREEIVDGLPWSHEAEVRG